MTMTVSERADKWINGSDKGSSSKAIWAVMMGEKPERHAYPNDGSDLGRCMRLLELIPEWRERLFHMASVSEYWAALVAVWPQLEALHRADDAKATYAFMKSVLDPIEDRDPTVFRMGKGVTMRIGR